MIYAYDKAANIPLVDIYDKLMMLAEIAAAKDMYEKGLLEMKDFREKYGDLMFSDPDAQQWYNNQFNIGGFVNDLYKQGIDPVRSAEGRALVQQYINSRNYGDLNLLRQSDANKKMYEASVAKLGADYDPEFEAWRLGFDPRTHSMVNPDGTLNPFLATSAMPYTNLHDMVHPTFAAIKPHLLNAEQVKGRGYAYDPNYDYEGITEDDMRRAMEEYMPGVRNNTSYKYQRYLAEQDLIREGNENPTQKEIDARLVENAITSDAGVLTPLTRDKNLMGDNWLRAQDDARNWYYEKLKRAGTPGYDENGNPDVSVGGKGGKVTDPYSYKLTLHNAAISLASGTTDPTRLGAWIKTNLKNIINTAINEAGLDENNHFFVINTPNVANQGWKGLVPNTSRITREGLAFVDGVINRLLVNDDKESFPKQINAVPINSSGYTGAAAFNYHSHAHLLHSPEDVVTHMYGFEGGRIRTNTEIFKEGNYAIVPTGYALGQLNRDSNVFTNQKMVKIVKINDDNTISTLNYIDAPTMFIEDEALSSNPNEGDIIDFEISERALPLLQSTDIRTNQTLEVGTNMKTETPRSGTETGFWGGVPSYKLRF